MGTEVINHLDYLPSVAAGLVTQLNEKEKSYGASWKKRGGVGAFMMLARKWDRLEKAMQENGYDIFEAALKDRRAEGVIDDIRDLSGYLLLVLSELEGRMTIPVDPKDIHEFAENLGYKSHTKPSGMEHPFGYNEEQA